MTGPQVTPVKEQVREFYDRVGWSRVGDCCFQNARYEDLRPVSQEYIQRCHRRVARHLAPAGRFFLDAGSGPIQYPEYLEYSRGYEYRVCADISYVALREARQRIGIHGLFVVADVANMPFRSEAFDGLVSLHTIHHLPGEEHRGAYEELYRLLSPGASAVVVNGWRDSLLMRSAAPFIWSVGKVLEIYRAFRRRGTPPGGLAQPHADSAECQGTYVQRQSLGWFDREIVPLMPAEILPWRSVSTTFLRTMIHPRLAGRKVLRGIYGLEGRYPRFFGRHGQYPLIVIRKPHVKDEG